ncbi:MAG: hypothetical protein QM813_22720 [Verrucomicrobiota bacterium]
MRFIILIGLTAVLFGCHSPKVAPPAAWHKPQREYQVYDSVAFLVVDYALVQRIRIGMSLTEVAKLVGTEPIDYSIHPDYALLCTEIDGQAFEVALRHGREKVVTAISFKRMGSVKS